MPSSLPCTWAGGWLTQAGGWGWWAEDRTHACCPVHRNHAQPGDHRAPGPQGLQKGLSGVGGSSLGHRKSQVLDVGVHAHGDVLAGSLREHYHQEGELASCVGSQV